MCISSFVTVGLLDCLSDCWTVGRRRTLSDGLSDCRTDCRTVGRAADSGRQCGSMSPWSYCRNSLSDNCRNDCRTVGLSDRLSEYCRILSDKPVGLSDRVSASMEALACGGAVGSVPASSRQPMVCGPSRATRRPPESTTCFSTWLHIRNWPPLPCPAVPQLRPPPAPRSCSAMEIWGS